MLSDDAFRRELDTVVTALRGWVDANRHRARATEETTAHYWRLAVDPIAEGACRFELVLRADRLYDIVMGGETYEDRSIDRFDLFAEILTAIGEGRVITRTWVTSGAAIPRSIETIVELPGAAFIAEHRLEPTASRVAREDCVARDRHWVPYGH